MMLTCMMALSCSTGSNNVSETDSMNAIDESNRIMDTAVGPNPNGYAPPNTAKIPLKQETLRRLYSNDFLYDIISSIDRCFF